MEYGFLGDKEQTFLWLEKASAARSELVSMLKTSRCYDFLRSDPRYADLVRRVGPTAIAQELVCSRFIVGTAHNMRLIENHAMQGIPTRANEPAEVCILSPVPTLFMKSCCSQCSQGWSGRAV
jgi:hypothetical protein